MGFIIVLLSFYLIYISVTWYIQSVEKLCILRLFSLLFKVTHTTIPNYKRCRRCIKVIFDQQREIQDKSDITNIVIEKEKRAGAGERERMCEKKNKILWGKC